MSQPDEERQLPHSENEQEQDNSIPQGGAGEPPNTDRDSVIDYSISAEENAHREEMANKFYTLAKEIGEADDKIKELLKNTIVMKQKRYARMDAGQESDFLKQLEQVNRNLGSAQALLDAYIELDKSTPEFKNFYNKFYQLYESITKHRRSIFYNYNIAETGVCLYPLIEITTKFGGLSFLFARLCGVLKICGDYIKDVIFLTPRVQQGYDPSMGYGGGYYPHGYVPAARPDYYYDDRLNQNRGRKPEMHDIGDQWDRV